MRLIVSPAKRMRVEEDGLPVCGLPALIDDAARLMAWMRTMDDRALARLWNANSSIVAQNLDRLASMDLHAHLTPAVIAYDGIQYRTMVPSVFTDDQLAYVQQHLRILSGFYGVLRPLDGVVPYRLEMGAKGAPPGYRNLYDFWADRICACTLRDDPVVVNLASKEYARCIEPHLPDGATFVSCVFAELAGECAVTRATQAKMARGEMVRYAADIRAQEPADLKGFDRMGYRFDPVRSTNAAYVFVRGRGAR